MKNDIYAIIGIVYTMLVLPITTIMGNSLLYWMILIAYLAWMVITKKTGFSIVMLSICLCQPTITSEEFDVDYINHLFSSFYYVLLFLPFIISIYLFFIKGYMPFKNTILISIVFLIIGLMYGLSLPNIIYKIVVTHFAFYIGFYDRLNFESLFRLYGITVLVTAVYAIIDYFLGVTPYTVIYASLVDYSQYDWYVKRASGLLGNPLILLLVATFYQALICYKGILTGKLPVIPQLLCLTLSLIVVSRTALLSCVVFLFFYFVHIKSKISVKQIISITIIVLFCTLGIMYYFSDTLNDLILRLSTGNNLHRQSSFQVTYNILSDNIFGIGFENYANQLGKYAAQGTNTDVHTLDNLFLTQLAHYGIIGFYIIYFYVYYFWQYIKIWKRAKWNKEVFYLILAFFISAICFDFEAYNNICFVVFVLIGSAFSRLYNYYPKS